jgi:hypothetical protein
MDMSNHIELLIPPPATEPASGAIPAVADNLRLDRRWVRWLKRGRIHDRRVRRRFSLLLGGLTAAAVLLFVFSG